MLINTLKSVALKLGLIQAPPPKHSDIWLPEWSTFLTDKVAFYRSLSNDDKLVFEQRSVWFWHTTRIDAEEGLVVTYQDRLLVAASAIIPVWAFPKWHYFNLDTVILKRHSFNEKFECGQADSMIAGMVGTGPMAGKMALSQPHLHLGFSNHKDKKNVGIHEFVHLIDLADGECDGFPERLKDHAFSLPWFDLVRKKIDEIHRKKSNIDNYGTTNNAEFFSVVSEYFFERPVMLQKKHPVLYQALEDIYQQDIRDIEKDIRHR